MAVAELVGHLMDSKFAELVEVLAPKLDRLLAMPPLRNGALPREADLLPVPYFHVAFTLPAAIADIAYQNKAAIYDILFTTSADAHYRNDKIVLTNSANQSRRLFSCLASNHIGHFLHGTAARQRIR